MFATRGIGPFDCGQCGRIPLDVDPRSVTRTPVQKGGPVVGQIVGDGLFTRPMQGVEYWDLGRDGDPR